ncbi:response regulator [Pseudidiomarina taiwanensis]|uniref:Two-component system response regulator n=1 Tax=Pseudidiomarina taiwanensis TaxID=337250 RepID=A0A432ZNW1_9GAMM|nr:response regulator [Pseudidiomarina taiwanensis]RUO79595.1 two-component system response regulator [Pseudidiomarina taiwanensis]
MTLALLLVEDNPATRGMLQQMLAGTAYRVVVAKDGLEGLSKAKAERFDAVLIDHKMPLMDGVSLIKNLRSHESYQQAPLILMTTQDIQQVAPLASRAGADLCLAKPLQEKQILEIFSDLARTIQGLGKLTLSN